MLSANLHTCKRRAKSASHSLALAESGMKLRGVIDTAFARLSFTPMPQVETNAIQALMRLVAMSNRATMLNRLDVADKCATGGLAFRSLIAPYLDPQPLALVARRSLDPLATQVTEKLQERLRTLID